MKIYSEHQVSVVFLLCISFVLAISGCDRQSESQKSWVIAWVSKNGMGIDSWQAGQLPGPDFDHEKWVAEGRAHAEAEATLLDLLAHPDERVHRMLVIRGLGAIGTPKAIPALSEVARRDQWGVARHEAIDALGCIGDKRALPTLADCMSTDVYDRVAAAEAIVQIGDPVGIELLNDVIERDKVEQTKLQEQLEELMKKTR